MSHVDEGTLHALVDNELPEAERLAVEAHLATCGECARHFADATAMARQVHTLLGALDEAPARVRIEKPAALTISREAPTPVRAAALASINVTPMQRRMRMLRRVAVAASVLVVAGVSYRVGVSRTTAGATEKAVLARPVASRAVMPAASVVEAAPEAIAVPSAPTMRLAPRGGPRVEGEVATGEALTPAAPAPALAAVPPMPREVPKAVVAEVATAAEASADRAAVPAPVTRERTEVGVAARRSAPAAEVAQGMVAPASAAPTANAVGMAQQVAKVMPSALPGYQAIDEVAAPSITRRRYIAADGATVTLLIAPLTADASKPVAKASEFTVRSSKDGSTVRWQRNGLSYELQGPLAPDSLVKLATQLK